MATEDAAAVPTVGFNGDGDGDGDVGTAFGFSAEGGTRSLGFSVAGVGAFFFSCTALRLEGHPDAVLRVRNECALLGGVAVAALESAAGSALLATGIPGVNERRNLEAAVVTVAATVNGTDAAGTEAGDGAMWCDGGRFAVDVVLNSVTHTHWHAGR